jgi:hypothetical protein
MAAAGEEHDDRPDQGVVDQPKTVRAETGLTVAGRPSRMSTRRRSSRLPSVWPHTASQMKKYGQET